MKSWILIAALAAVPVLSAGHMAHADVIDSSIDKATIKGLKEVNASVRTTATTAISTVAITPAPQSIALGTMVTTLGADSSAYVIQAFELIKNAVGSWDSNVSSALNNAIGAINKSTETLIEADGKITDAEVNATLEGLKNLKESRKAAKTELSMENACVKITAEMQEQQAEVIANQMGDYFEDIQTQMAGVASRDGISSLQAMTKLFEIVVGMDTDFAAVMNGDPVTLTPAQMKEMAAYLSFLNPDFATTRQLEQLNPDNQSGQTSFYTPDGYGVEVASAADDWVPGVQKTMTLRQLGRNITATKTALQRKFLNDKLTNIVKDSFPTMQTEIVAAGVDRTLLPDTMPARISENQAEAIENLKAYQDLMEAATNGDNTAAIQALVYRLDELNEALEKTNESIEFMATRDALANIPSIGDALNPVADIGDHPDVAQQQELIQRLANRIEKEISQPQTADAGDVR